MQGDRALHLVQQRGEELIAQHCRSVGALQLVLRGAALDVLEIEPGGLSDELDAQGMAVPLREQALRQRAETVERIAAGDEQELDEDPAGQRRGPAAVDPVRQIRTGRGALRLEHDLVDDQFADEEHRRRLQRAQQPDERDRARQLRACPPQRAQQAWQVRPGG